VVLGEVVAEEAGGVRYLQELQPLRIELMQGYRASVNPIEHAKGHLSHCGPSFLGVIAVIKEREFLRVSPLLLIVSGLA
jgi:hypothetical protein